MSFKHILAISLSAQSSALALDIKNVDSQVSATDKTESQFNLTSLVEDSAEDTTFAEVVNAEPPTALEADDFFEQGNYASPESPAVTAKQD